MYLNTPNNNNTNKRPRSHSRSSSPNEEKGYTINRSVKSRSDRVVLDVGGSQFVTSISTLTANSTYFRCKFSDEWYHNNDDNEVIFVDQEPEPFGILLSYMRVGYVECKDLSKKVLALAEFLGVDRLLFFVKCTAYRNCNADFSGSDHEAIVAFDMEYGGIIGAISLEILPLYLQKRNMGQKEFSSLYFRIPEGGSNLEACVSAPENIIINNNADDPAHYVDRVPNCCTLLDALNWLNRNGFTHEEKSLQALCDAEVQGIFNYIVLGQLMFSRKTFTNTFNSNELNAGNVNVNVIIGRKYSSSSYSAPVDEREREHAHERMQKEFAMITIRQGEVVVEADYGGALLEIEVNGVSEKTRISTVEGINTVEGGMNWLHRSRFTQRETRFEEFYRGVVKDFQARMELQDQEFDQDRIDLEFMIFSRPLSHSSSSSSSQQQEQQQVPDPQQQNHGAVMGNNHPPNNGAADQAVNHLP